jgi:hypothetical protein
MPRKLEPHSQCEFRSKLNRRCKMLLAPDHPQLCAFHARAEAKAHQAEDRQLAASELLAGADSFSTPTAVNLFLGNLLKQMAAGRIPRRQATAMAYISQLLLNSISVMQREARDIQAAAAAAGAQEPIATGATITISGAASRNRLSPTKSFARANRRVARPKPTRRQSPSPPRRTGPVRPPSPHPTPLGHPAPRICPAPPPKPAPQHTPPRLPVLYLLYFLYFPFFPPLLRLAALKCETLFNTPMGC